MMSSSEGSRGRRLEIMLSEESSTEDGEEVLFVRPLTWRALCIKKTFD